VKGGAAAKGVHFMLLAAPVTAGLATKGVDPVSAPASAALSDWDGRGGGGGGGNGGAFWHALAGGCGDGVDGGGRSGVSGLGVDGCGVVV